MKYFNLWVVIPLQTLASAYTLGGLLYTHESVYNHHKGQGNTTASYWLNTTASHTYYYV